MSNKRYYIVEIDGKLTIPMANDGRFYYGGCDLIGVRYFSTKKEALQKVDRLSYSGMSFKYEVRESVK